MPVDERGTWYLDNSTLAATAKCSSQTVLRNVYGYTGSDEKPVLTLGTAFHEGLAVYLQGGGIPAALSRFDELYRDFSREHVEPQLGMRESWKRLTHTNGRAIFNQWLATHPLSALPFVPVEGGVEVPFEEPFGPRLPNGAPEFVLIGRLDVLARGRHDRNLYVTDHKTTGELTPWWIRQFGLDSQMSGYCWAARRKWKEDIYGVFINAIEITTLPSSDRKCKTHGVPYKECGPQHAKSVCEIFKRLPEQITEWEKTALHLARKFKTLATIYGTDTERLLKVRTQGTFNKACDWCFAHEWCEIGRPLDQLDHFFAVDHWDPRDRAKEQAAA